MTTVMRRYTFKLYPSKTQVLAMESELRLHQALYNAALQQRVEAWRRQRKSLSYADQCKELTALRREDPAYGILNGHALQETLQRLDKAFKAFFRRLKSKANAGFPRFRSLERFPGWGYKLQGDGFKAVIGTGGRHGKVRLTGIGFVRMRGRIASRILSTMRVVRGEILRRDGGWILSIVVEGKPQRMGGTKAIGLDWGVADFATMVDGAGVVSVIVNPARMRASLKALKRAGRALARKRKGGKNRAKARLRVATLHKRLRQRRHDFLHQHSARLVAEAALIAGEDIAVSNLTRSAKGDVEAPGRNVRQKAGLNREILDTAPAAFHQFLRYKAEEAGTEVILHDPRKTRASQVCPACGFVRKKTLGERLHCCVHCGHTEPRDVASARVLLALALNSVAPAPEDSTGREPSGREVTAALAACPRNHPQSHDVTWCG